MNKIYVLEDDCSISELIEFLLVEESYTVECFTTCKAFFRAINFSLPDLVILDVSLPDGDGLKVCQDLSSHRSTSEIPVLIMSAHAKEDVVSRQSCAKGFIPKPFDIDLFIHEVNMQMSST